MAPITITQIAGLQTSPNPLDSPPGALQEALNCVVRRRGVIESRRGFDYSFFSHGSLPYSASAMLFALEQRWHFVTNGTSGALTHQNADLAFRLLCMPRDDTKQRMRLVEAARRVWVADRAETKAVRMATVTFDPEPVQTYAGFRAPPDILASASVVTGSGSTDFFKATATVAYRYTLVAWLDGRVIESAPSGRFVITNTAGAFRSVKIVIPRHYSNWIGGTDTDAIRPTHIRLYRSEQVLPPQAVPSDELFLCAEVPYISGPGAYVTEIVDNQPESLLGEPVYTNPITGNGILDANYPPPTGVDVQLWDGRLWFGNTRGPSRAEVLLVGVGSAPGLVAGNTISIFGTLFTAVVGVAGLGQFSLYTIGTPAQNIEQTARNLVDAANIAWAGTPGSSDLALSASYISTPDDAPGLMTFWKYTSDGSKAADVVVSPASPWQITQQTTQDHQPHGLAFSKPEQPDAFPPTNTLLVNTDAFEILRLVPLRDRLYVFKPDGIYVVSGSFPYRVDLLDGTCRLIAPDAVAVCNGSLYALTSQGAVAITDSGARIVSLPIEAELRGDWQPPQADNQNGAGRLTFAAGYESERLVYFWIDGVTGYVLNTMHNTWTKHLQPLGLRDGTRLVDAVQEPTTGFLILMERGETPADDLLWDERKAFDRYDFAELVGGISALTLGADDDILNHAPLFGGAGTVPPTTIQPGDVLRVIINVGTGEDGDPIIREVSQLVRIEAVGPGNSIVLDGPLADDIIASIDASAGGFNEVTIFRGIHNRVTYSPITAGQPSTVKRFREATLHFTTYSVESANILAETDMAMVPEAFPQPIESPKTLWTAERDGPADAVPRENKRRLVPRDKQMGAQILISWDVEEAFCTWALCGVSVEIEGVSERNSR